MKENIIDEITCDKCGSVTREFSCTFCCDNCKEVIEGRNIDITIFFDGNIYTDCDFCSVKCMREFLKNYKENFSFISLPYIYQNEPGQYGITLSEFLGE